MLTILYITRIVKCVTIVLIKKSDNHGYTIYFKKLREKLMKIIVALLFVVSVSGCSSLIGPSVEMSTARTVVIESGAGYGNESTQLAEQECQKYGRHAQLKSDKKDIAIGWVWTFDCVE